MHPFLSLSLRLVLGGMWLLAGVSKLRFPGSRAQMVEQFELLPASIAALVGQLLPWAELTLGIVVLTGAELHWSLLMSAVLLVVFTLAVSINLVRGRHFDCMCFGEMGQSQISWWTVTRNSVLLAGTGLLIGFPSDYLTLVALRNGTWGSPSAPDPVGYVPIIFLLVALGMFRALIGSAWDVVKALIRADDGPAIGLSERTYLKTHLEPYLTHLSIESKR